MSEIDLEAMRAKIKTHDLLDEHDGDFVVDLYTLVSEVERLRARVKELDNRTVVMLIEAYTKGWFDATTGKCCNAVEYLDSIKLIKEAAGDTQP